MKTDLLASLEAAIQQWLSDQAENNATPTDVYFSEDLVQLMARAAESVFDSSASGQRFAKEQEPSE